MTLSLAQLAEGPKAQRLIEMPTDLKRLIRRDIVLRGRGDESVDQGKLNAHANLSKAKLSALLALMEGRDEINMEDWELAEILWEAFCELRAFLIDEARREAEEKQRERTEADLQKAVTIHTQKAAADRSIEIRARWVWEKVSAGARTLGELNKKLGSGVRHTLRPGVELAVVRDWVRLSDEGELSLGPSQPGKGT
ncbi:hypothetical protein GCM10018777_31480 [Streptomyces albogriseolus]|uniref:hypothetical protein n=1 Tax=Streptomyces TaxID=1883 RepID=UPI0016736725|nr:hypothetical protein [Streptomyces viridodiastaticus]GHG15441.1 hypothetical protein GCM10018777_31480 [Streptomyces viridodiastaticus]